MSVLPIKYYGEKVLREKARPITREDITPDFLQFLQDMGETMYDAAGIGLAANQVGDLRRVFVVDVDQMGKDKRRRGRKDPARRNLSVMINPEILEVSTEDEDYTEGCLSIPDVEADVWRPIRIRVRYHTPEWELREEWMEGILARVFQHELDHLDGILFIDRLPEGPRMKLAGALKKIKQLTRDAAKEGTLASAGKESQSANG